MQRLRQGDEKDGREKERKKRKGRDQGREILVEKGGGGKDDMVGRGMPKPRLYRRVYAHWGLT